MGAHVFNFPRLQQTVRDQILPHFLQGVSPCLALRLGYAFREIRKYHSEP